ncbi:RES family NAD+ phosphorylase [Niabella sp. CJ426]|uniref:RES family NAD+ phosphorylase n=1 Tax=Niabella sp. CJ426 TaxID=3393740 RepID=UPI003D00E7A8
MKVYRISKCKYIDDLSGTGSSRFPGRWHNKGTYILYTAASPSLAMLESVVHITTLPKIELCMTCLEIPDGSITELSGTQLPENWFTSPPPDHLKYIGDQFIQAGNYLALKIPSAVMPEEFNILLNPAHPLFRKIKVIYTRQLRVDERLFRS